MESGGARSKKASMQSQIHRKNIALSKSSNSLFGQTHSRLIDKYASAIKQAKLAQKENPSTANGAGKQQENVGVGEGGVLRREIARMSEVVKKYKEQNEQIGCENEQLLGKYRVLLEENRELRKRLKQSEELTHHSFEMGRAAMEALPAYQQHIATIATCNSIVNEQAKRIVSDKLHQALALEAKTIKDFVAKIEQLEQAQADLREKLTRTQGVESNSTQLNETLTQTLNHMNSLMLTTPNAQEELDLANIKNIEGEATPRERCLDFWSETLSLTMFPFENKRVEALLEEIKKLLDDHIHLLESQKMEYQVTKNRKLIACQKYECNICGSYEKIVGQMFSIVREAFKKIKFTLLTEMKMDTDISEIPILI